MSNSYWDTIFERFNDLKVLIIGDVMVDSYLWGGVGRISPEAPVPIVDVKSRECRLGGAANVALNLKALGATPYVASVIGDDSDADILINLMKDSEISSEALIRSHERTTTIKHRIIADDQHVLRVDQEVTNPISEHVSDALCDKVFQLMEACDVVLFQDYDKGVLTEQNILKIIHEAKQRSIPTVVDPKKRNFLNFKGVDLFKPNFKELSEGLKLDIDKNEDWNIVAASNTLREKLGHRTSLLTLSEKGIFVDDTNDHHFIPAHIRDISDVSGAGDTVISVASLCLALNMDIAKLAALSNLSGGIVCESVGVIPVSKEVLLREAQEHLAV